MRIIGWFLFTVFCYISSEKLFASTELPEDKTTQHMTVSIVPEELILSGNLDEINRKILELLTKDLGSYSEEDIHNIIYINDHLVSRNHKEAIRRKISWLEKGKIPQRCIPSFSGYSIKYYGSYLDRVMNDPSMRHAREPYWAFSHSSPSYKLDLDEAEELKKLLDELP